MKQTSKKEKSYTMHVIMLNFFYRISNALKLFVWAFMNPETANMSAFKMLSDLQVLILKVATENRHYMTHISCVHPEEGEKQMAKDFAEGVG